MTLEVEVKTHLQRRLHAHHPGGGLLDGDALVGRLCGGEGALGRGQVLGDRVELAAPSSGFCQEHLHLVEGGVNGTDGTRNAGRGAGPKRVAHRAEAAYHAGRLQELAPRVIRVDHVALGDLSLPDRVVAEVRAIGLKRWCGGLPAAEEVLVAHLCIAQGDHLFDDAVELRSRFAASGGGSRVAALTHAQLLRAGKEIGKLVERGLFGIDSDPNAVELRRY